MSYNLTSRYFEDFEIGEERVSVGRTITETDLLLWGALIGDWHPLHWNEDYATKKGPFGKRVVFGWITLSYSVGLLLHGYLFGEDTILGFAGLNNAMLVNPVFMGDTIYTVATVKEKKETRRGDRGLLTFHFSTRKQDDSEVAYFDMTLMMKGKKYQK